MYPAPPEPRCVVLTLGQNNHSLDDMLNPAWLEPAIEESLGPNLATEAAGFSGATSGMVRVPVGSLKATTQPDNNFATCCWQEAQMNESLRSR